MKSLDRAVMSSGGNQVDVEKIRRHLAIAERRMGRRLFNGPTADNPSGKRRRVVRELDDALKQDLLDWVDGGDEEGRIAMLDLRSEEHTSELQSLMRISYAVFCLNKKKQISIQRC